MNKALAATPRSSGSSLAPPRRRHKGASRGNAAAILVAVLSSLVAGCRDTPPPTAAGNLRLTDEEKRKPQWLGPEDQAEVRSALASVAVDHEVVDPPAPAPPETGGMRWADMELAVDEACAVVETAVIDVTPEENGRRLRFRLITIEDWPGTLVVDRTDGPGLYTAEVTFGRFPDDPKHAKRSRRLLAALEVNMKAFGRKRSLKP